MAGIPSELHSLQEHDLFLLGLAREGLSSYHYLRRFLPETKIYLIDDLPPSNLTSEWQQILNLDSQTTFLDTPRASKLLQRQPNTSAIIKSPGIPLHHPLAQLAREKHILTTSNIALFFLALDRLRSEKYALTTIGITGTKGKSTTTSVIHHVLKRNSRQTWLGGNIGVPALDLLQQVPKLNRKEILYIVLELSAHQLDELSQSPNWAVVQNIVPEHLDYYDTFERYVDAKSHITRFQSPGDVVIFNPRLTIPLQVAEMSPGKKIGFLTTNGTGESKIAGIEIGARVQDGWIWHQEEKIIALKDVLLLGQHNQENVLPAVIIGQLVGLKATDIAAGLRSFQPLPHRLEPVGTFHDVTYINDSLSTVPEAAMAAVEAMGERPVILLAGGYDRGQDFSQLAEFLSTRPVKALVLFPPTGKAIAQAVKRSGGNIPLTHVETMAEAVTAAQRAAQPGDVVLLSPASASFGGFKDYQDRGDQFKQLISSTKTYRSGR